MQLPETAFRIARIEAFHLHSQGDSYWRGFRGDNRAAGARYLLKDKWRTVYAREVETCLVKITLDDGSTGWGEATEPVCPEVVGILCTQLFGDLLPGRDFAGPAAFRDFCYDLNRGRGHLSGYQLLAIAALDIALCDALSRRDGVSFARWLGSPRETVPVYLSGLRQATPEERVDTWAACAEAGFGGVKIFADADLPAMLDELDRLRAQVPGDWRLMADSLWSVTDPDAARPIAAALAERRLGWWECPLVPEDLEGHVALHADAGLPLALGEHFFTRHQLRDWLARPAFDILQPDIGRTGLAGGVEMAGMARAAGRSVTPHMGTGSPVVQAAALSFHAAVAADHLCEFQMELSALCPEVFDSGWRRAGGEIRAEGGAGIGVAVDEAALRARCVATWAAG
jgi:galactonate dehydratase